MYVTGRDSSSYRLFNFSCQSGETYGKIIKNDRLIYGVVVYAITTVLVTAVTD